MLKVALQDSGLKAGKAGDLDGERKCHLCFLPSPGLQNEGSERRLGPRLEYIKHVL